MWPTLLELLETLGYICMTVQTSQRMTSLDLPTCRGRQCETSFRTQDAMHFGDLQRGGHYYCAIEARPSGNNWGPKPWLVLCRSVAESVLVGTASFAACERGAKKSNMPLWSLPCVLSRFILKAKGVYSSTNWLLYLYVLWFECMSVSWLYILFYRLFASVCPTIHPFRKAPVASVGAGKAVRFTIGRVDWEFAKGLCRDLHEVGFT